MAYDHEGRLIAWQNTWSSPTATAAYAYDGAGQRVAQSVTANGSTSTTYYVGGGLEELTVSGASSTLTKYESVPGVCSVVIVGSGPGEAISYVLSDGLGSVSEALDGSGHVTAQQLYGPYGGVRYSSGSMPTAKGYTGQRADAATGLDYYSARYYDAVAGQFTSADTVQDGLNRYAYVAGNPETATDPTGHLITCMDGCGGGGGSSGGGCRSDATCGCYVSCGGSPGGNGGQPPVVGAGGGRTPTSDGSGIPDDARWGWRDGGDLFTVWTRGMEYDAVSGVHFNLHVAHFGGGDFDNLHIKWAGRIGPECPSDDECDDPDDWTWNVSDSVTGKDYVLTPDYMAPVGTTDLPPRTDIDAIESAAGGAAFQLIDFIASLLPDSVREDWYGAAIVSNRKGLNGIGTPGWEIFKQSLLELVEAGNNPSNLQSY